MNVADMSSAIECISSLLAAELRCSRFSSRRTQDPAFGIWGPGWDGTGSSDELVGASSIATALGIYAMGSLGACAVLGCVEDVI